MIWIGLTVGTWQEPAAKGVKIAELENDWSLQDAVLSVHHACMLTVGNHPTNKLIENHKGVLLRFRHRA
jgi:hypothetical protein